jgi:hypothetical protein
VIDDAEWSALMVATNVMVMVMAAVMLPTCRSSA